MKVSKRQSSDNNIYSPTTNTYIPITKTNLVKPPIVKSKVLIIDNIEVNIDERLDQELQFEIHTNPAKLQDGKIPKIDITAKENIVFDDTISLSKLQAIIRRCGVLEDYKDYFTNDPEIVINSYTLKLRKEYQFFNELKEGVLIAQEIFM